MTHTHTTHAWDKCEVQTFWAGIAPGEHLVQIYENDDVILEAMEGFSCSGFHCGDSVIIIATQDHIEQLTARLEAKGFNIQQLIKIKQFIPLNAAETLSRFMVVGWPDEVKFNAVVAELLAGARGHNNRRVRAYGEMVALLWAQGYSGATIQLENLWNKFVEREEFCLFCAYPKKGFTQDLHKSIGHICSTHTKVLSGEPEHCSQTEVFFREP